MDRTIQVSALPTRISKQSLEDKLMIHFLRSKNGGGEIIDILFPSESAASALIIFEEAEVAQRILRVGNHVLEINGKHHKLKVEPACTEIKVDQVICHVSMTIDYGKLLGGKRLMSHFQKTHRDIHFNFDQKAEQCNVSGTFSAIQELSGGIHHLLNLNPNQTNSDSYENEQRHHNSSQSSTLGRSNSIKKAARKSNADSSAKGEHLELQGFAHGGVGRDADLQQGSEIQTRNFEDYILLMDSDIYGYIQKFCKDRYQNILHQHPVKMLDFTNEDITTLILQESSDCPDSKASLFQAHQELSKLYQDFEFRLRKEQIDKKDIASDITVLQNIYASLQVQFPKINFSENINNFYLIGTSDDCSLAKKYLQDLKEELAARSQKGKHPASRRDSESRRASISSIPQPLQEFDGSEFLGVSKADARKDHKLAPTFSGLQEKVSPLQAGRRLAESDWIPHAADNLMTGLSVETSPQDTEYQLNSEMQQKARHHMIDNEMFTSADRALTGGRGESVVPNKTREDSLKTCKDFSVLSGQSNEFKSPDKIDDDILFKGHEDSSIVGTNKGDNFFQYAKSNKSHGPIKPYHFETSAGTLFHQGDLLGNIQTLQSVTPPKGSEGRPAKPSLRRTSSFSEYLKSKHSREVSNSFQGVPKINPVEQVHITQEFPIESVVWSYLKDIYDSSIRSIGTKTEVVMNEQIQGDITVLKLTAFNKANITAAKQDILSLYTLVMKHLVQQFLPYTDLGIEDYSQKAVEQWYNCLKNKFPEVKFIMAQTGFKIIATYEHCTKVIETFKSKLKGPFSSTDIVSISASNPCSFIGTETFKGTEGKDLSEFTAHSSSLKQDCHGGRKPNGFETPVHLVDETSPKKGAKTKEHLVFQTDRVFTEAIGHRKGAGNPKKNCNSQPDMEEGESPKNQKYSNENDGRASNSRQEHNLLMDQKKSPKAFDEYSGLGFHDQGDYKSQKVIRHIGDGEGVKAKKALPDKFHFTANKVVKESHWYTREDSLHCNKHDSGAQSLPIFSYTSTAGSQLNRDGPHASESATNSGDQSQEKYSQQQDESNLTVSQERKTSRNSQQNQPRGPAIGLDAQELNKSAKSCSGCKKSARLLKLDCGHGSCEECYTNLQSFCPACNQMVPSIRNESWCLGSMDWTTLNISLDGFYKDLTLKITYKIPDGIQRGCDPNPGETFTGGLFKAYLPDNCKGKKILKLLIEAFNRGLTFKIVSAPSGLPQVTWNDIPHKTKITGGRSEHGYPDSSYLKNVLTALEKHGLQ
ncbi:uncharacterized protein si:busm1-163l24.3 [Carcharodon carcharias]|uniref:uncharacterized protein si:busm1-163l24.3 n=1 Tax=Carcharodon carcharias TaxID=13397 RepID=UPI001B7E8B1F|nr:uncharacterized protein si:busm1-163l24.3 [Carcharodon carcharias]XP_041029591.1 uncharacterized protein si:busm1-163l24.3 [Carcharodon carcharias]